MRFLVMIILLGLLAGCAGPQAYHHPEKYYQERWCNKYGGVQEYRLKDGTRVDCLTSKYAVEFDFAQKWAESIGQALYYAEMTGRRPGVVLIMETPASDERYMKRLRRVAGRYGITVWSTSNGD